MKRRKKIDLYGPSLHPDQHKAMNGKSLRKSPLGISIGSAITGLGMIALSGTAQAAEFWWSGVSGSNWTDASWSATAANSGPVNLGVNADAVFSIDGGGINLNTNLNGAVSISSLRVRELNPLTINGDGINPLTIVGGGSAFAGSGINIQTGAGLTTINADVDLGLLAETVTVNNTAGLVINGDLIGANGLIKEGTEVLTLTGANTYTGATAINAGTLQVNSNNALGTIAAGTTVADGATLALNNVAYSTTEALTINGAGVLGGGALTNTGTSSYAGQITAATNATINAGGGVLTLSGGLVKDGTTLTLTGGGTINIDTVGISGASVNSDLIVDSVTVNLNVANTYNGPTFIRSTALAGSGILNANAADALPTLNGRSALTMDDSGLGSSQLNLVGFSQSIASLTGAASSLVNLNANTLTIGTTAGSTTFAGVISGTGGLTKDGASTQILTGANTYTGATNVMDGTLQLGNGITTGSSIALASAVTVDALGTLALNLADGETFSNSVVNNGTIQWIASGTNTQGATSIFSGLGDMLITGSGTTELLGINTFTGGTTVNTTGDVLVGNSSSFGSGPLTINNGTIDTVNSQPLQINVGNYVQTGGELRIRLSGPGGAVNTQYNATGTADINGGTVFLYDDAIIGGYSPSGGDSQTIIQTTLGVIGTGFADDTPDSLIQGMAYSQGNTLLYPTLRYDDPDSVYVLWVQDSFAALPGQTPNQTALGNALDAGAAPAAVTDFLNTQDVALLPALYDLISPDELTSMYQMGFAGSGLQNANIQRHLERVRRGAPRETQYTETVTDSKGGMVQQQASRMSDANRWSVFLEGHDGSSSVDGDGNASGYDFDTRGATLGADLRVSDRLVVGILGAYTESDAMLINGGSIEDEAYKGAIYATYYDQAFYVDALLGVGSHSYDITRTGLSGIALGETEGWEIDALINTGYDMKNGNWTYGPTASIAYTRIELDEFSETGSLAPLSFPDQHQDSLRSQLGAKLAYTAEFASMTITPQVRLAWQHEFMDSTQSIDSSFVGGSGGSFSTSGPSMDEDRFILSAGLTVQVTPNFSVYGAYDGYVGSSDYDSNQVTAGIKFDF